MATEIERKFLIAPSAKWTVIKNCPSPAHIRQGYVSVGDPEIRIRSSEAYSSCKMTIKFGDGLAREEIEMPVSGEQALHLWENTRFSLNKARYKFDRWEIDVFEGDRFGGLILAEIELYSESEALPPFPDWLGHNVLKEVTDDPKYKNKALAQLLP